MHRTDTCAHDRQKNSSHITQKHICPVTAMRDAMLYLFYPDIHRIPCHFLMAWLAAMLLARYKQSLLRCLLGRLLSLRFERPAYPESMTALLCCSHATSSSSLRCSVRPSSPGSMNTAEACHRVPRSSTSRPGQCLEEFRGFKNWARCTLVTLKPLSAISKSTSADSIGPPARCHHASLRP